MKKILGLLALLFVANPANAILLDFEDSADLGVTLGGDMTWNSVGGGHLYNESFNNDDYIIFSTETYVNSFEMNAMPWENYGGGTIGLIDIAGLNNANQTVWSATVDLRNYTDWNNWYTVTVESANIMTLAFMAPGLAPHNNGFWPSVDNLVINEQSQEIPVPSTIALFFLGLAGLGFARKKKVV
ncbi:PEP-CTERM sorting domain-containing protein [Motiliproteus coralliicola]|nr:PEP-CTERM sorting domain-containing protein [Motiliproteus coralliicola]